MVEISKLKKMVDDFQLGPIDVNIEPGTITAIVGNNGSGKSTLLKLIMHQATADTGYISVHNKPVAGRDESWKHHIAYLPQTVIGYDPFTGNTLKELISTLYPNWDEKLFVKLIEAFNVPMNKNFSKLSQGVQQKLNLALTIPRNTRVLLLDEPTAFMDIPSKKYLMDILVDWMDQDGRTIVITSHQAEDIKKLADDVLVLQDGNMIGNFAKETLTESYRRYWLSEKLQQAKIPGEIAREHQQLISNQPEATEQFFRDNNIEWVEHTALDLEEVISLLSQKR